MKTILKLSTLVVITAALSGCGVGFETGSGARLGVSVTPAVSVGPVYRPAYRPAYGYGRGGYGYGRGGYGYGRRW